MSFKNNGMDARRCITCNADMEMISECWGAETRCTSCGTRCSEWQQDLMSGCSEWIRWTWFLNNKILISMTKSVERTTKEDTDSVVLNNSKIQRVARS